MGKVWAGTGMVEVPIRRKGAEVPSIEGRSPVSDNFHWNTMPCPQCPESVHHHWSPDCREFVDLHILGVIVHCQHILRSANFKEINRNTLPWSCRRSVRLIRLLGVASLVFCTDDAGLDHFRDCCGHTWPVDVLTSPCAGISYALMCGVKAI